ncbi:dicarboxylate/amino acid:cation symporter [Flavobacterium macrobrachii]|jgi:Na+/H+-dicarboxylate symporter|uniref:Cation:dicarboxylase symporter family transporter n=1 Tax=Flavobacterium macrobrachii TaxID=591204 RepID=A0ABS2CWG5_9FLAO|nr:cation:dicarboxylase symporter family transporter [Flavobacterium macrobrachii]MBM6499292.1 cation:dicarboxylase symporter family transporter [Flavobacterium macrobrachii]PZO29474.1 MAG: dicarboxylate/amino acid:cation symporter [Flavobacteriaceae bacterium]
MNTTESIQESKKSFLSNLTVQIIIAMLLGAILGIYIHNNYTPEFAKEFSDKIKMLATIFIRLVQMIIAPLVITTLVVGIAKLGDIKSVGRIGGKAMGWFFTASFVSLLIGLFWVNILQPGVGLNLTDVDVATASEVTDKTKVFSAQNFVEHIIPKSIFEALATNEILQIVIFSIFFGLAAASIGDYAKPVVKALDVSSHIILKMVNYVMKFAPLGVFGAIAGVFAIRDLQELLITYAKFFGSFLVGISSLWVVLLLVGYLFLKGHMTTLLKRIFGPLVIAFGTTSSEAVFPKLTEELERFGVKDKIVSFMLPLGYSFNLDGSMMYMTFASIFIAQAYGVHLDLTTQMTMLLVLMLTSKGIAGVPRASLVVVAATCGMFDIPIEGIALILPIDHFCDMFRSATNVLGNALATSVVGKWEKES